MVVGMHHLHLCILYLTRLIMFSKVMPCTNQILLHFILQSGWCVYTYCNSKRETWIYFVWISLTDLSALNIDAFNGSMNLPHNINKQASVTIWGMFIPVGYGILWEVFVINYCQRTSGLYFHCIEKYSVSQDILKVPWRNNS